MTLAAALANGRAKVSSALTMGKGRHNPPRSSLASRGSHHAAIRLARFYLLITLCGEELGARYCEGPSGVGDCQLEAIGGGKGSRVSDVGLTFCEMSRNA